MEKVELAVIGCGGMGGRHLSGLNELLSTPFANIELAGLCDINRDNAEMAAAQVERMMGFRAPRLHRG